MGKLFKVGKLPINTSLRRSTTPRSPAVRVRLAAALPGAAPAARSSRRDRPALPVRRAVGSCSRSPCSRPAASRNGTPSSIPPGRRGRQGVLRRGSTSRRFPTSRSRRACGRAASSATTSVPRSSPFPSRATRSRYTLDVNTLGTHQFNKGVLTLEPRGGKRLFSDEVSGILYTCRGGFLDIAHVRDNADRTLFFASQIERWPPPAARFRSATTARGPAPHRAQAARPSARESARLAGGGRQSRRVAVDPGRHLARDHHLVRLGLHPVLRAAVRLLPGRSLLQPHRAKLAGTIFRRHAATSEVEYDLAVTAALEGCA